MLFDEFAAQWLAIEDMPRPAQVQAITDLLRQLGAEGVAAAVHLLQGRFSAGFRPREEDDGTARRQEVAALCRTVIAKQHSVSPAPVRPTIGEVYQTIQACWPKVRDWLHHQSGPPAPILDLACGLRQESVRVMTTALTGPLADDELLFRVVAGLDPAATTDLIRPLKKAYQRTLPDLGIIAAEVFEHGIWATIHIPPRVGVPVPPERLRVCHSVKEAWEFAGVCLVQPKYDGWYVQVHKLGEKVQLFSRGRYDEEWSELTARLPDVVRSCLRCIGGEAAILEGEIVGYQNDLRTVVRFEDTLEAPLRRTFLYEVLYLDGVDHRAQAYMRRRQRLERLVLNESETVVAVSEEWVHSLDELERVYERSLDWPEAQGVVVRKWQEPYRSGQDSLGKAKLKNYTSIDAVVLGYRQAGGRLTSLLAGIWDRDPHHSGARLIPVAEVESAKAGSKSKQWAEIVSFLQASTQPGKPERVIPDLTPDRWVRPQVVVEIGCDGLRKRDSRFRTLGYTFHDKTWLKLREDKSIWDADDVNRFMGLRLAPGES